MPEQRQLPLDLHLEMFLLHQEASHHTGNTQRLYRYELGRFVDALKAEGVETATAIAARHIRQHMVGMERRELAASTIHVTARCIKAWLNFLVAEEVLTVSPMRSVKMPKLDEKILPPFDEDEIRRLLAACAGPDQLRNRAMILCLLDTGLRASEFLALTVATIDRKDGSIRMMGKGRKERWTRVSARTRKELLRYLAKRGGVDAVEPLWIGRKGTLTIDGLYQVMKRLGKKAGIAPVGLHRFRRTFAIAAHRNGMDLLELKEILGHADLATTRRYLKFDKEDMLEAHRRASPVERWDL